MQEVDSKTPEIETFAQKLEKNTTVIKIVEQFYMKEILDDINNNPYNIFTLLDEEIIRLSDTYKNEEKFNANITINLLEVLIKRNYKGHLLNLIFIGILYHITLNNDENFKVHSLFFEKLNAYQAEYPIVSIILDRVKENFETYYPNDKLKIE